MVGNGPNFDTRHRALIVAEMGLNHNGDFDRAMEMVRVAAEAGVDVVKMQLRSLRDTYTAHAVDNPSDAAHSLAHYMPVLKDTQLAIIDYSRLSRLAKDLGVGFLVTPWDVPSVKVLEDLGVEAYKTASGDIDNLYLHEAIAKTGKPVIVSTGMMEEPTLYRLIPRLLEIHDRGHRMALMHTVSSYPTAYRDCQLHNILKYKVNFQVPVGWSGHERAVAVSVAAAALGADIIERHFTLDRTLPGPDQAASLEPDGLTKLVERVRAFEAAYGDPGLERTCNRGEVAAREVLAKSLTTARDLIVGQIVTSADLCARGPGRGVSPMYRDAFIGKAALVDIKADTQIERSMFDLKAKVAA